MIQFRSETTVLALILFAVGNSFQPTLAQESKSVAGRSFNTAVRSDDGLPSEDGLNDLIGIMRMLTEKRLSHTAMIRTLKDKTQREQRSGEFPPIEKELEELVVFESKHRGTRTGALAMIHIVAIASSFSGTQQPIHLALDKAIVNLSEYGHLRDIVFGFDRMVALDGLNLLPAISRLIESKSTLPVVRSSARLCRARWQLEMVENMRQNSTELETLSDPADIKRLQEYLKNDFPSELDAQRWKSDAISELTSLAEDRNNERTIAFKADPTGIVLVEDADRTSLAPTIAETAAGFLFRARHLSPGGAAPELNVELVTGDRWRLNDHSKKVVIVQFSFKGCGPCERMYPVLRQIAKDYRDKVSILSIMADSTVETTRDAVAVGKMTWNVAWDGDKGPIATKWGIREFPSVFVFGTDGKLLGSGIPAEYLAEIVKTLLDQETLK